jgi:hypothetical protein
MKKPQLKLSLIAGAIALTVGSSGVVLAEGNTNSKTNAAAAQSQPMTGKEKATAIGAGTGAVAGAVVGGPVGALVGAGVGAYVGHEGTDANGRVDGKARKSAFRSDESVRQLQTALNAQGYSLAVDGVHGPATENALRDFQAKHGLASTGQLDSETKARLGLTG